MTERHDETPSRTQLDATKAKLREETDEKAHRDVHQPALDKSGLPPTVLAVLALLSATPAEAGIPSERGDVPQVGQLESAVSAFSFSDEELHDANISEFYKAQGGAGGLFAQRPTSPAQADCSSCGSYPSSPTYPKYPSPSPSYPTNPSGPNPNQQYQNYQQYQRYLQQQQQQGQQSESEDEPYKYRPSGGPASCFVATVAFGGADAPELKILRGFRDDVLLRFRPGHAFVEMYYRVGPIWASHLAKAPRLKRLVKEMLIVAVKLLRAAGVRPRETRPL